MLASLVHSSGDRARRHDGFFAERSPKTDTRYRPPIHGGGGAPVREGMGEDRKISGRSDQETRRDGLLRDAGAGRVGRAGTGYRFVCADAGGSGARAYGDVHGAGRDEFGGAGAADDVWHGRAEEKIF